MNEILITSNKPENPIAIGRSKMWGPPDLPEHIDHPIGNDSGNVFPLNFICQINCRDVAPYDTDNRLPKTGFLYFFADIDYYLGYYDCQPGGGTGLWPEKSAKVFYFDGSEKDLIPLMINKEDVDFFIDERELSFSSFDQPGEEGHKLLGKPYHMLYENFEKPVKGWELLFQLDSDEGNDFALNFMDVGILYFLIDEKDLKNKNFANARAYMVSS
ncbi:MAG: DUF1963 domain-containing protein [Bacteroidales bacterium]|jgi:uncharacterized protein YwqG|nr:DUF1963 domain-containing protein [Bacteroidales bacterium]